MPHEVALLRSDQAPRAARATVAQWFNGSVDDEELETAQLVVSELVTNAVVHGVGKITLRADLHLDRLRVEVIDDGSGFAYDAHQQPLNEFGRRGLKIVSGVSAGWGVFEGTTHVWAEIPRASGT